MKKNLLKTLACAFAIALMASCSTEETDTIVPQSPQSTSVKDSGTDGVTPSTARGDVWAGTIATIDANGNVTFSVDPELLIDDLNVSLRQQGVQAEVTTVAIEEKTATNDPSVKAYMVIGSDGNGTSIGVLLQRGGSSLSVDSEEGDKNVSCRGCATGCNMSFLIVSGHKYPYCNENGCGAFCERKEG
ncbi:hypothetical protein FMM05_03235 [Flavobacterium zepuense]|uniref:Lipoprotein n=1 Tax=Flavobacterium zepuense TaxID=2593302 RepID=A0A552V7H2_9FLAO|nr:hypothetical protein [Flavobacterium zepuense]TRW26407.1 hypothetical protein FMM05_03235 [Flavobacterium zepuense]